MAEKFVAPYPGSQQMPQWTTGELIDAPKFTLRNWTSMLGPGLVMGGAAIGGGEWLLGPLVTAKYGPALLWVATLSILGQVIYNIEISRYTLYSGEPIFSGKFRTLPGPLFWVFVYLVLDFGMVFPYLAAAAAAPVGTLLKGGVIPNPMVNTDLPWYDFARYDADWYLMKGLSYAIFLGGLVPLLFGGKVYNSLKVIMSFKIVVVFGFLLVLAIGYSSFDTWVDIGSGFFKVGSVPIKVEPDEAQRGNNVENVFVSLAEGRGMPDIDYSLIALIAGLAAIAGSGGLSNTPISNYTRDQGWGMGHHVGAIPSVVGGHNIQLSHVGCVFDPTEESLPRWRRWYKHVVRDQLVVWMPACFIGIALPSMLSVQFLPAGFESDNKFATSVMTAGGVRDHVTAASGEAFGSFFWFKTVFCGFIVLAPSVSSSADGLVRRWVDVFWTGSKRLRALDQSYIKTLYFRVLAGFAVFGMIMLALPLEELIGYATMIFNIALGFSCWHTLVVNTVLLPRVLRPHWLIRIALVLAGCYFTAMGVITVMDKTGVLARLTS